MKIKINVIEMDNIIEEIGEYPEDVDPLILPAVKILNRCY